MWRFRKADVSGVACFVRRLGMAFAQSAVCAPGAPSALEPSSVPAAAYLDDLLSTRATMRLPFAYTTHRCLKAEILRTLTHLRTCSTALNGQ